MDAKPSNRSICMNCAHFRGDLNQEETKLLNRTLQHYKAEVILESWVKESRLKIPGGSRIDKDKARVTETLRKRAFCQHETIMVSPIDVACYAFKSPLQG